MKKIFITLVAIISMLSCVLFSACLKNEKSSDILLDYGSFNKRVDVKDLTFTPKTIDKKFIDNSNKLQGILHIMDVVEYNVQNTDHLLRLALGDGSGTSDFGTELTGNMKVRSLTAIEDKFYYYAQSGVVYSSDPESLLGVSKLILEQCKRVYSNDNYENSIEQDQGNSGKPVLIDKFPYFSDSIDKKYKKVKNPISYHLKHKKELTNFKIDENSFIENSLSLEYDSKEKLYKIAFNLDCKNDKVVFKPRELLRKCSKSKDLEYNYFNVKLEVYDNGLLKSFTADESWEATINLGLLAIKGASKSLNTDYFSWDPKDSNFEQLKKDGIINLDWID